jgi:RNase P subunit RPR2
MQGHAYVIALIPMDMETMARQLGMDMKLTIPDDYIKTPCDECQNDGWISPSQREMYETKRGPVALLCYRCIIAKRDKYIIVGLVGTDVTRTDPQ